MVMVGRRDDHGVDARAQLIQQLAIIVEPLGILELLGLRVEPLLVDVADAHDPPVMTSLLAVALPLPPTPMQAMFSTSFGPTPPAQPCRPWRKCQTPRPRPRTEKIDD